MDESENPYAAPLHEGGEESRGRRKKVAESPWRMLAAYSVAGLGLIVFVGFLLFAALLILATQF